MEEGDPSRLPAIPAKRYFTIGEVSELCGVKAYVLRYWEQEFTQLRPMKRRGNRRYYQHHEVLLIRRIRDLLYDQGFTISGARNRLVGHGVPSAEDATVTPGEHLPAGDVSREPEAEADHLVQGAETQNVHDDNAMPASCASGRRTDLVSPTLPASLSVAHLREELQSIRSLLVG